MKTTARTLVLLAMLANLAFCGAAFAGTWLCSLTSATAVDEDGTVGPPDLGGLERPTFLRVDTASKEVRLLAPASRRGEVTKIDSIREEGELWLMSGVEKGRAWSLIITARGDLTLSIVGDGVTWSGFGHALSEAEAGTGEPEQNP